MPASAAASAREILVRLHDVMAARTSAQGKLNQVVGIVGAALDSEVCSPLGAQCDSMTILCLAGTPVTVRCKQPRRSGSMSYARVVSTSSVGEGGTNKFSDVRAIQELINQHLPTSVRALAEDGRCGPLTNAAIEAVQKLFVNLVKPDGRIDIHGPTLRALNFAQPARRRNAARVPVSAARPAPRRTNAARPSAPPPPGGAMAVTTPGITPAAIAAAQAAQRRWHVPASITLAQYIQESSAGRHMPAGSNNPFGMKARRGQPSVTVLTREETHDGRSVTIRAPFRRFASINEAFDAHGQLLATGRAYALARTHTNDPDAYADALTHHYATDSHYGRALKSLMRRHDLYSNNLP